MLEHERRGAQLAQYRGLWRQFTSKLVPLGLNLRGGGDPQ